MMDLDRDDGIPDCIRRDVNNVAPFMVAIGRVQAEIAKTFAPAFAEIFPSPEANPPDLCDDEGCPQHGTPHVCVWTQVPEQFRPKKMSEEEFRAQHMQKWDPPEYEDDAIDWTPKKISPEANPPASPPNWVPPWLTKT